MRRWTRAVALLAVLACEEPFRFEGPPTIPVATVTIAPDSLVLTAGQQSQLIATPRDSTGAPLGGRSVTWSTTDSTVAAVSPTGVVAARDSGIARIVATVEGKADTARAIVRPLVYATIAGGEYHTCATTVIGSLHCWGLNLSGQIGTGTGGFRQETPARVAGTLLYAQVELGAAHSCALALDATAHCWGSNTFAQLGRVGGSTAVPGPVIGGATWRSVVGGADHTCGIAVDSLAYCWGSSNQGQVGDSLPPGTRGTPRQVAGGRHYGAIVAGLFHTCGLTGGTVWCWGWNHRGQLGDSSTLTFREYPVRANGLVGVTAVAGGVAHTCAIGNIEVLCWGDNTLGQLGQGATDSLSRAPVAVPGVEPIGLTAGRDHTCALVTDSTAVCWGANDRGQLGDGTLFDRPSPVAVLGGFKFVALAAGYRHTCGVTATGAAYCWGAGTEGQLGNGNTADFPAPQAVIGPRP